MSIVGSSIHWRLQAVGGGEEEVDDAIGVEGGVDPAGSLLVADHAAEQRAEPVVAIDEECVCGMRGIACLGRELGIQLHETGYLAVVADHVEERPDSGWSPVMSNAAVSTSSRLRRTSWKSSSFDEK